jgi:sugar O-acyltransferase (sialic acid O-acetyltransferase NeuD family)
VSGMVIVGAGGHARVLIDVLASRGITPIGVVDPRAEPGTLVAGISVLGDDSWLDTHREDDLRVVVGLGSTGSVAARESVFESLRAKGLVVVGCVHASVIFGADCRINATAQVLPGCVINNSATIGANTVIYSGSIIEHDCIIDDHAYLSPGVTLCGGVHVGTRSFIGAGATVLQGVRIGAHAVVAAGAVVTRDVADGATVMGVPAKVVDSAQ